MKRLIKLIAGLLRPLILTMVLCLIFALLIYFFGERVGMRGIYPFKAEVTRYWVSALLLCLSGLLFLWQVVSWLRQWRAGRTVKERREPTVEELEIAAMDSTFAVVMKIIRSRWSSKGRGVYGLPWYLVLGKPDAGKTSIIENGDLRFPIDHEIKAELAQLEGRDATWFVNWRVSGNEAVLLDMAGEFFVPHGERTSVQQVLWDRFLINLQKYRPRRPINGVVLTIDLMEFAGYSQSEREDYSNLVRRTIDDLVERLGTRLTVYIAFTKIDQLAGFSDFFECMSASERESLFGFHFLYEGKSTPSWLDQFETQYSEFLGHLDLTTKKRLRSLKSVNARQEAYAFSRELMGLEAPLTAFLTSALQPDKFSTAPLVRGIYFVSNTQENAPRNVFLEAVGQRYNLAPPLYGASQGARFPYFVRSFFKKAVFPEAGLAGNNQRAEGTYRRRMAMTLGAGVLACLLGGFYWNAKYNENLFQASAVLEKAEIFTKFDTNVQNDPLGESMLEPLNTIRGATFEFGDYREISAVEEQLTLYQGNQIGPIADTAYRTMLNNHFAPMLVRGVADELRDVCPKGSDEELEFLRVYRMLGDQEGRDDRVVSKYFSTRWQERFEGTSETQDSLNSHLDYMLTAVPSSYELDENLIAQAQNNLGSLTPYRRVYSSLVADAQRQLPNPIEFETSIGASFGLVYQSRTLGETQTNANVTQTENGCGRVSEKTLERAPFEVPRLFTSDEFKEFFIPQNTKIAQVAAKDLWVLGSLDATEYSEADYAKIQAKVLELYTDDYMRVWRQTLNAMEVRDFKDLRDATEILRALSGSENPIRRAAQLVAENTIIYDLGGMPLEGTEAAANELPFDPDRAAGNQIYDAFGEIRRMLEDKAEGGQPNIDQIEEALTGVYDYMKIVRDAPDPNAKALEVAIERAELTGEDPIYVLQRIAERSPAPFNDHLKFVANESWRVIMVLATEELNRKWHEEIYGDYQRLIAGKYPFNRVSELDLPVEDFEEFFEPGGILENFYQKELLIFVSETTGEPRIIDGQSLAVDADFAANLRKAIDITKSFFNTSGDLSVEFKVHTQGMSANLSRAVLNFEGQLIINSHGPSKPISIVWPNLIDQPASSRVDIAPLYGTGGNYGRQFDGPWSWLRLYDAAGKTNFQNNSVDLSFTNSNGQSATFRIRPEARVNPFFNSPLSEFTLPSYLRTTPS